MYVALRLLLVVVDDDGRRCRGAWIPASRRGRRVELHGLGTDDVPRECGEKGSRKKYSSRSDALCSGKGCCVCFWRRRIAVQLRHFGRGFFGGERAPAKRFARDTPNW